MRRNGYQDRLDDCGLLDNPDIHDIWMLGGVARAIMGLTLGWMQTLVKKPGARVTEDAIAYLLAIPSFVANNESESDIEPEPLVINAEFKETRSRGAPTLGAFFTRQEGVDLIVLNFNKQFSALDLFLNEFEAYYGILYSLSHEVGHSIDPGVFMHEPGYKEAKGALARKKYEHDRVEMRARLWGAQVAYTHAYLWMAMWAEMDGIDVPKLDVEPAEFLKFIMTQTPLMSRGMNYFNHSNALRATEKIQECVEEVLPEVGRKPPLAWDIPGVAQGLGIGQEEWKDPKKFERKILRHFRNVWVRREREMDIEQAGGRVETADRVKAIEFDPILEFDEHPRLQRGR